MQGTKVNSRGKEMPHGTRLYSIAASRYGDTFDGKTTSLCVRRAEYWDPEMNAYDPAKKGLCSNFLCDSKPGDEITMTGESPSIFVLFCCHPCIQSRQGAVPTPIYFMCCGSVSISDTSEAFFFDATSPHISVTGPAQDAFCPRRPHWKGAAAPRGPQRSGHHGCHRHRLAHLHRSDILPTDNSPCFRLLTY